MIHADADDRTMALSFKHSPRGRVLSKAELLDRRIVLELDELERVRALAGELHPDHWPIWMRAVAVAIESGDPHIDSPSGRMTTGRLVGCVAAARVFEETSDGRASRRRYAELVRSCALQRVAIACAWTRSE